MKYEVKCKQCSSVVWIRGSSDPSVNAIELDDGDDNWNEACSHIQAGDYEIGEQELIED